MFGSASLFVLHHPVEFEKKKKDGVKIEEVTYDLAQEEIAENSGFNMNKNSGQSKSKYCSIQSSELVHAHVEGP